MEQKMVHQTVHMWAYSMGVQWAAKWVHQTAFPLEYHSADSSELRKECSMGAQSERSKALPSALHWADRLG